MSDFFRTGKLKDKALSKVILHIKSRHPDAIPIYYNEYYKGDLLLAGSAQIYIVGHGTNDGYFASGETLEPPKIVSANVLARRLKRMIPEGMPVRIKLAQCWGGLRYNGNQSFAGDLASYMGSMGDRDYDGWISVGGYEHIATWLGNRASRATGRVSTAAPIWAGDPFHIPGDEPTKLSRLWFNSKGEIAQKLKSSVEKVFVYFPFDYPIK
jgi:hypothetical protein